MAELLWQMTTLEQSAFFEQLGIIATDAARLDQFSEVARHGGNRVVNVMMNIGAAAIE